MSNQIVSIPFHGQSVQSVAIDGKPAVAFKPMVENLGLSYSSQLQKLKGKSWATVSMINTVGADGKNREMSCIDLRTLTMWLATIDENRVSEEARPLVVAYQNEVATYRLPSSCKHLTCPLRFDTDSLRQPPPLKQPATSSNRHRVAATRPLFLGLFTTTSHRGRYRNNAVPFSAMDTARDTSPPAN